MTCRISAHAACCSHWQVLTELRVSGSFETSQRGKAQLLQEFAHVVLSGIGLVCLVSP
jgi:hypothetical protein